MSMASFTDLNQLRVDHIGSLVRPAMLKDVFARLTAAPPPETN